MSTTAGEPFDPGDSGVQAGANPRLVGERLRSLLPEHARTESKKAA